jgi:hypothetical protein
VGIDDGNNMNCRVRREAYPIFLQGHIRLLGSFLQCVWSKPI